MTNHATIQVAAAPDGTMIYSVPMPPEALPPVSARALMAAWEQARDAAGQAQWGAARLFRFHRPDGGTADLALADTDARCWAAAIDRDSGIHTTIGLSLCVRLLALVDLLARAGWARGLFHLAPDGAELHPALLRAAATAPLTAQAGFDEHSLRGRLAALPPPRQPTHPHGEPA